MFSSQLLNLKNFKDKGRIGKDAEFDIHEIVNLETNNTNIAKILAKDISQYPKKKLNELFNQLNINSEINHPSIIKFIGYSPVDFAQKQRPIIVTNLSKHKTLLDLLQNFNDFDSSKWDTQKFIIIYGIASAMSYLHSHDIIHCNLTASNVYLDDSLYPKIFNSSFSKKIQKPINRFIKSNVPSAYLAPEILSKKEYSKSSDIYAFSILLFELFNKSINAENESSLNLVKDIVVKKKRPTFPKYDNIPVFYQELIENCWSDDPSKRPTFDQILKVLKADPFLLNNKEYQEYIRFIDGSQNTNNSTQEFNGEMSSESKNEEKDQVKKKLVDLTAFTKTNESIEENIYGNFYEIVCQETKEKCLAQESSLMINDFSRNDITNLCKELSIISQINHPAIVKFIGYSPMNFYDEPKPVIINELLTHGTLSYMLKKDRNIQLWDDTQKLINLYGIASAMSYLHSHNILHCDLKPQNIYFDELFLPKIAGFHLSKELPQDASKEISSQIKGTPIYLSPEIYLNKEYSKASDVYAFSLIAYEIMTNEKPFKDLKNVSLIFDEVVHKKKRPIFNSKVPDCYKKLIEKCWSQEPNERPTFDDIVKILRTDSSFITETVNDEDYKKYIKLIDESPIYFDQKNRISYEDITDCSLDSFKDKDELQSFQFSVLGVFDTEVNNISLDFKYLDITNFEKLEMIGKGGHSTVFKVLEKSSGKQYSAKIYDNNTPKLTKTEYVELSHDVNFISQIDHPCVNKFIGYSPVDFDNKSHPILITELSTNRTLSDVIDLIRKNEDVYEWDDTKKLINIYGIASIMAYLHSKDIIYCDLKPKNILLDDYLFPKIIDFGSSVTNCENLSYQNFKGTPLYTAPEILNCEDYGKPIDVYSFSLVVYEIMTNIRPFSTLNRPNQVFSQVKKKKRPEISDKIPKCYRELIEKCWSHDPNERPTFDEILNNLRTNSDFITDDVDEDDYKCYIEYIDKAHTGVQYHSKAKKQEEQHVFDVYEKIDVFSYFDEDIKPKLINIDCVKQAYLYNFEKQKSVGSGSFGTVYKVKDSKTGNIYAAKISKIYLTQCNDDDVKNIEREISIISKLNHPSILKFIGYTPFDFKKKSKPTIITEFLPNGSLEDIIKLERSGHSNINWNDTKKLINIYGIAAAMEYLHMKEILHRDLKPANILLDDFLFPKLSDFGLSKTLYEEDNRLISGYKGTYSYSAPEVFLNEYSKAGDVYAFGIMVYEIITNLEPYPNFSPYKLLAQVPYGFRPEFKVDIPICYKKLIESCWANSPNDRPSFTEIVNMLKTNDEFITKNINRVEFYDYINYIDNCRSKLDYKIPTDDPIFLSSKVQIINWDDFKRVKLIDQKIEFLKFKLIFERTKQECVAKISGMKMKEMPEYKKIELIREVSIISQLNHPLFTKFFGYSPVDITLSKYPVVITEMTSNGSLESILKVLRENGEIQDWNDTTKLINLYGIAYGMNYLHSEDIIHRNLSPSHIFLDEKYHPKIGNFEFSKYIFEELDNEKKDFLGTYDYCSPEVFRNQYSKASDVFAFGMIAYEIITNKSFYNVPKFQVLLSTLDGFCPEFSPDVPNCYRKLITECLSQDPAKRPSFNQIINYLKNDSEFITEKVDQNEYRNYIEYIDSFEKTHIIHDLISFSPINNRKEQDKSNEKAFDKITVNFDLLKEKMENDQEFQSEFLDLDKFKLGNLIKKHDYSKTYQVISKETNEIYSGKISTMRIDQFSRDELISLSREVNIISQLHHPSFLKFIGYSPVDFKKKHHPIIVTELAANGSLKYILDKIREKVIIPKWNDTIKLINIFGIASGMSYLHSNKILHRALSPENVFLDEYFFPKIGDFGLSTRDHTLKSMTFQSNAGMKGNPTYSSPETLQCNDYTKSSDVYSFAFVVYEILTNEIPFDGIVNKNKIFNEVVINGNRPKIPETVPDCYRNLIIKCWAQNSNERPSFDDIVQTLKTDSNFISDKVNKNDYLNYVDFIEESRKSFDSTKRIIDLSEFIKEKNNKT